MMWKLGKKALLGHTELIILQESVLYCEKHEVDQIRYSELRRECDKHLSKITNGQQTQFGGRFNHWIDVWSDPGLLPERRLFTRVKRGRKQTFIVPNIEGIKSYLQKKKL
jgi:hypothetical protein